MSADLRLEPLHPARKAVVLLFLCAGAWYLLWRAGSLNPEAPVFSWALYLAEIYGFLGAMAHFYMNWSLTDRRAPAPEPSLSVDVFIPTYNEPVELVRRTVLAAVALRGSHTTWVLDDGDRPEMAAMARELGAEYLARKDNQGAKAGNLNHALARSRADLVAIFDADHAPKRDFLEKTTGYFRDPKLAFVQTPQDFYNLDSFQHRHDPKSHSVWTEQSLFFRVIQRGKDRSGAAFFCGSCAIARREALEAIGGFAEETITEDLHTSVKLHKAGWRSAYHPESLAFGVAPSAIGPFLKQRIRWGQGAMQVWRKEALLFSPSLSWGQKINYIASIATYFDGWQKALFYVAPAIVLLTGALPIRTGMGEFLWHFVPFYLLSFLAFEEVGRGFGRSALIEQYNMGRFAAFLWSTLGLLRRRLSFKVTDKALAGDSGWGWLLPQAAILGINLLAIPVGVALASAGSLPASALWANIAWAAVNILLAASVLSFARRQARLTRQEYRFRIPLPAKVLYPDGKWRLSTVDDISPKGCSLYGLLGEGAQVGSALSISLLLPDGPLSLTASIADLKTETTPEGETYAKGAGARFSGAEGSSIEALELFLYGSDLEWRLRGLSERARTPLELLGLVPSPLEADAPEHWTSGLLFWERQGSPRESIALLAPAAAPDDPRSRAIAFEPLPEGALLRAEMIGRSARRRWAASVASCEPALSRGERLWILELDAPPGETAAASRPETPSAS